MLSSHIIICGDKLRSIIALGPKLKYPRVQRGGTLSVILKTPLLCSLLGWRTSQNGNYQNVGEVAGFTCHLRQLGHALLMTHKKRRADAGTLQPQWPPGIEENSPCWCDCPTFGWEICLETMFPLVLKHGQWGKLSAVTSCGVFLALVVSCPCTTTGWRIRNEMLPQVVEFNTCGFVHKWQVWQTGRCAPVCSYCVGVKVKLSVHRSVWVSTLTYCHNLKE